MGASEKIKKVMIDKHIKAGQLAEDIGMEQRPFSTKLYRNTMKFAFVEQVADALGCDVVFRDRETGKIYD